MVIRMDPIVNPPGVARSFSALRDAAPPVRERLGCADTFREILQQPATWRATGARLRGVREQGALAAAIDPAPSHVVLTGSGSSLYVGECLAPALQRELAIPALAVPAASLLTDRAAVLPRGDGLLVSIARSGDSPESTGVLDGMLGGEPDWKHLVMTCNASGALATAYRGESRVRVLLLDPVTNDRSLVMTSSFSNLLLCGSALAPADRNAGPVAAVVDRLFERYGDALATWGSRPLDAAVYLGSGANLGAAREAGLKMLEMSAGAVRVMSETHLGLRHGPMAWLNRDSLVVSLLSGRNDVRAYETDLLRELTRKRLGLRRIVVGENLDPEWVGDDGLAVDLPGLYALPSAHRAMVHVVAGQLLALFQCLALGEAPDAPSKGVLTRVVEPFAIHDEGHGQ